MEKEKDFKNGRFIALALSPIAALMGKIKPWVTGCNLPDGIFIAIRQKDELLVFFGYDQPPQVFKIESGNPPSGEMIVCVKDGCVWESDFYGF